MRERIKAGRSLLLPHMSLRGHEVAVAVSKTNGMRLLRFARNDRKEELAMTLPFVTARPGSGRGSLHLPHMSLRGA